jgi:hypothetical protein
MIDETDPLAVIKVTFEDVPDEFKDKLSIFFGAGLACIILINIILCSYILDNLYNKVRYLTDKDREYYQPV